MIGLTALATKGLDIIDKFIPDPEAKAAAKQKLLELADRKDERELAAHVSELLGQIEINKIEAASKSLFKSGWRPAVGWTCAIAFSYKFVIQPFLVFAILVFQPEFPTESLPELSWTEMSAVLLGMLGLSHHRSSERKAGKVPLGQ